MKRLLGVGAMLAAIALAGLYAFGGRRGGNDASKPVADEAVAVDVVTVAPASRGAPLRLAGVALGAHDVAISPRVPARITAVHVRNGSVVARGARLVSLDLGNLSAQLDTARAGVAAARAVVARAVQGRSARLAEMDAAKLEAEGKLVLAELKLREAQLGTPLAASSAVADADRSSAGVRQAEAGVRQAEIGAKEADDAVKRLELLHRHGGVSDIELSGARSKAELARAALDTARAALDLARAGARPAVEAAPIRKQIGDAELSAARAGVELAREGVRIAERAKNRALTVADRDVDAAKAQLLQAQAGLKQALAAIGTDVLTSPIAGVVTKLTAEVGAYAQPGFALMRVVSPSVTRVEASVPARFASRVRVGQIGVVSAGVGNVGNTRVRVTSIGQVFEPGGRSFRVSFAPISPASLRPGSEVTVTLTDTESAGPTLPGDAVMREARGLCVYMIVRGRAVRKPLDAAPLADGSWQVRSGVTAGERLICPIPDGVTDGTPVEEPAR